MMHEKYLIVFAINIDRKTRNMSLMESYESPVFSDLVPGAFWLVIEQHCRWQKVRPCEIGTDDPDGGHICLKQSLQN